MRVKRSDAMDKKARRELESVRGELLEASERHQAEIKEILGKLSHETRSQLQSMMLQNVDVAVGYAGEATRAICGLGD